jgi:CBS domain-containing protein
MQCEEIMTGNPKYCVPTDSVTKAARVMKSGDVGALPVCQEDRPGSKLVGIVTDRDLAVNVVAYARDLTTTTVQDVMTPEPLACKADDDIEKAMDSMSLYQIRRIPVVGETGELIGIISQADVALRTGRPEKAARVLGDISSPTISQAA